jgi:hypothetical protein
MKGKLWAFFVLGILKVGRAGHIIILLKGGRAHVIIERDRGPTKEQTRSGPTGPREGSFF